MNKLELAGMLKEKFPMLKNEFFLELAYFCDKYQLKDYSELWMKVKANGDWFGNVPKLDNFFKAAKDLKCEITESKKVRYSAHKCFVCGTVYDEISRGCPVCRDMTPISIYVSDHPIIVSPIREECYKCELDYKTADGPKCVDYGKDNNLSCTNCGCYECCNEGRVLRKDVIARWQKELVKKPGEVEK